MTVEMRRPWLPALLALGGALAAALGATSAFSAPSAGPRPTTQQWPELAARTCGRRCQAVAPRLRGRSHVLRRGAEPGLSSDLNAADPQKVIVRNADKAAEFVTPAVWNRPLFRAASLVGGGALAGSAAPFAAALHLAAFGTWLGTSVWTTFIAGLTMFKNLPRKQFGTLQSKLFPQYFQLGTACTAVVILTGSRLGMPGGPAVFSLLCTLANLLYLEPASTSVMFARYDLDKQEKKDTELDKELKAKFSKLHGMSSLANLLALVALAVHGASIAARI